MARDMQFTPIDCGGLLYTRQLESMPHELMSGWLAPTVVMLVCFGFWLIYGTIRYYHLRDPPYDSECWPSNTLNKLVVCTTMWLLPLVFIPGCIAGLFQLIYGTEYRRFSVWLDVWLKMRKHLGYYALFFTAMHTVLALALMSPAYYSRWYHYNSQVLPLNRTGDTEVNIDSRMTWLGETAMLRGVLSLLGMDFLHGRHLSTVCQCLAELGGVATLPVVPWMAHSALCHQPLDSAGCGRFLGRRTLRRGHPEDDICRLLHCVGGHRHEDRPAPARRFLPLEEHTSWIRARTAQSDERWYPTAGCSHRNHPCLRQKQDGGQRTSPNWSRQHERRRRKKNLSVSCKKHHWASPVGPWVWGNRGLYLRAPAFWSCRELGQQSLREGFSM